MGHKRKGFFDALLKPFRDNWSESLQYIFISLAIAGSGVWAIYTFKAFEQRSAALAQLDEANANLEKTRAELAEIQERIDGNYSSNIDINTKIVAQDNDDGFGLIIEVVAKNVGTKDVVLDLASDPLTIYKTKSSGDRIMSVGELRPQFYRSLSGDVAIPNSTYSAQYISVGAVKKMVFYVEVSSPGVYYITFEADVGEDQKSRISLGDRTPVWFSSEYIYISKD